MNAAGRQLVESLARQHGVSPEAVTVLLDAVQRGGGNMAQFSHPELGGSGQWMRGGMTMVGDMFNHALKARVDALCQALADALSREALFDTPDRSERRAPVLGLTTPAGSWWPDELGSPSAAGSQNHARYAVFPAKARLVIDDGQQVTVYDTLDHRVSGVQQSQGSGSTMGFTSQHGTLAVDTLPVVSIDGRPVRRQTAGMPASQPAAPVPGENDDALTRLERLAALHERGLLSAREFAAKKAELLSRV